jgi:hypothetical protein
MTLDDLEGDVFTILSHQAEVQWNLKMSSGDLKDSIQKELKNPFPENLEEPTLENLKLLLTATANLFRCKIVVFNKDDNYKYDVIDCDHLQPSEAPLFLLRENHGNVTNKPDLIREISRKEKKVTQLFS